MNKLFQKVKKNFLLQSAIESEWELKKVYKVPNRSFMDREDVLNNKL